MRRRHIACLGVQFKLRYPLEFSDCAYTWYCGKRYPDGEAVNPGPIHFTVTNVVSLYNKAEWFQTLHDTRGVFFAVETSASQQVLRTEMRQLSKVNLSLHSSAPVRPKHRK